MTVEIPLTSHQIALLAALIALGVAASAIAVLFRRLWTRPSAARNACLAGATALVSLGLALLVVEFGVSRYWLESQGFGKALATQRWFERHWKPVNRYGFRDIEYEDSTMKATKRLFVVGDSLDEAFEREDTWLEHTRDLIAVRDFARSSGAALLVIAFPMLADVDWSRSYSSKVARFLAQERVEVIDLAYVFEDRDPAGLVVNARDHHPNEATHLEVAELIYERLRIRGLVSGTP